MSAQVFPPKEKKGAGPDGKQKMNMQALAEKEIRHYTTPLPEAERPPGDPFPRRIVKWTWAGAISGGMVGSVFGWLLLENILVIPGWEALYSMGPFTFVVFWALAGVSLGLMLVGIGAILSTPALEWGAEHDRASHNSE